MMKYPSLVLAAALLMAGCGEKKPAENSTAGDSAAAPHAEMHPANDSLAADTSHQQYFPVVNFIKGEIVSVDSLPVGIKKYTGNNKSKFVYIKSDEFHRLASEFTPPGLQDSTFFTENYKENTFFDPASGAGTFMYTAKNNSLPVQRIDVITMPGDAYDKVKSIYIQKNYSSGDTVFIRKLSWTPQQRFQIITVMTKGSGTPKTEITNVVWDSKEEG